VLSATTFSAELERARIVREERRRLEVVHLRRVREGVAGEREFSDQAIADPVILSLRGRVNVEVDRSIAEDQW
jgi:hypothetical protein